jgi:peptide/nickel transport system substrate-binding protein
MGRRGLLGAATAVALAAAVRPARSMGRTPLGGKLSVLVPHDTSAVDPHSLYDPMGALVGGAVFDTVFSLDASGNPYPSLADGMPVRDGRVTRLALREGLRSSRGRPIDAHDLLASIERARTLGAFAVLADIPSGRVEKKGDARVALFSDVEPVALALALCSPLVALAARTSSPAWPDGTGAFRAEPSADKLVLVRNKHAARGAAFLDEVFVRRAADLAEPLRAFEAQSVDVGWLGAGLHAARPGSVRFELGSAAWVVLRTGPEAGEWSAPGVAQRLIDAVAPARLEPLALGRIPAPSGSPSWGGAPCDLIVSSGSAHLVRVAETLASVLSQPGHEVTAAAVAPAELARRRRAGAFALMVELVRPLGPAGTPTLIALATADDKARARSLARHPPKLASLSPRALARTLRLGVVGELRVDGATMPNVRLVAARDGNGWDLGASWRAPGP